MTPIFLASEIHITARHIAQQLAKPANNYNTLFITTAGEPIKSDKSWEINNRQGLVDAGFQLTDYSITNQTETKIRDQLKNVDIVHVNGGNTLYLLAMAQNNNFKQIMHDFIDKGGIYIGSSAGSISAAPDISPAWYQATEKYALGLKSRDGFGLVDFNILPHWGRTDKKSLYMTERCHQAYTENHKLILLNDYQYVAVQNHWCKIIDIRD